MKINIRMLLPLLSYFTQEYLGSGDWLNAVEPCQVNSSMLQSLHMSSVILGKVAELWNTGDCKAVSWMLFASWYHLWKPGKIYIWNEVYVHIMLRLHSKYLKRSGLTSFKYEYATLSLSPGIFFIVEPYALCKFHGSINLLYRWGIFFLTIHLHNSDSLLNMVIDYSQ